MAFQPLPDVAHSSFSRLALFIAVYTSLANAAQAKLYVFGDSLSDNGNINKVTFGAEPGRDYYAGRFSNGPVWSELLGYRLGKAPGLLYYDPVFTSRVEGYNFAHGGAAAVERWYLPDFLEAPGQASYYARQVRNGRMSGRAGDVATLWIGGNDYLLYNEGSAPTVVGGVMKSLTSLDATGVGRIVLMNLPLLGEIPGELTGPDRIKLNIVSKQHNALLNTAVAAYRTKARAQITQVDVAALFTQVRAGAGGFTVTKPGDKGSRTGTCKGDGLLLAACPANYFFYDGVHPTASGHRFIAGVVRDRMAAPVAAAARVSLGQVSALSAVTAQLGQFKARVSASPEGDGPLAYAFGSGDAALGTDWSQGYGAEWRSGGVTLGLNVIEADRDVALGDSAMQVNGDAKGFSAFAAWRGDGLSVALAATSLYDSLEYRRETEIEDLNLATGSGKTTATSVQFALASEFSDRSWTFRPEAAVTFSRMHFSAFTETGTMGLSDNFYEAEDRAGTLGEVGATVRYTDEVWGVNLRAYAVANLGGAVSVWTAAPSALIAKDLSSLEEIDASQGAGLSTEVWLTGSGGWSLAAEAGAFTDLKRTEGSARVSFRYEF